MKELQLPFLLVCIGMFFFIYNTNAKSNSKNTYTINLNIQDKDSEEALIATTCVLEPLGAYATTDNKGNAILQNIPKGKYRLWISYVGYTTIEKEIEIHEDAKYSIKMSSLSLTLDEVVVVATQSKAGESTGTHIGRQAIEHIQAVSLDDVMQLIPGALMKEVNLTSPQKLQLRTLEINNETNVFGTSIVLDGIPISNNGSVKNSVISENHTLGTDLRQISADDIESVEVIQGIPSAEYGDLTAGLVIVHSKKGETPWKGKIKMNPKVSNFSLGKGFRLRNNNLVNISLDYAKAWSDPRKKTNSFNRYNASVNYSADLSKQWHTSTKVRYSLSKDWNGKDPDAVQNGSVTKNKSQIFSFAHNGRFSLNKTLFRTLNYTIGARIQRNISRKTSIVPNSGAYIPLLTAMETGYYKVSYLSTSYKTSGGAENIPNNIFVKIGDRFALETGAKANHSFNLGLNYSCDWNNGRGLYNDDENLPLKPSSNGRPRTYSEIPSIHRISAYAEDKFSWDISDLQKLTIQAGVRFSGLQPFSNISNYAISPRLNASLKVNKWLKLRGGIGWSSKTPGLNYLYPQKKYLDRLAVNYLPQDNKIEQLLIYHTMVYDVAKNENLRNARSRKIELGVDIKLPNKRKLRIVAYHSKTPNGFGNLLEYFTYTSNLYTASKGLLINKGEPTQVDWENPARVDTIFATKGRTGNTNVAENKGIELDFELGKIRLINTSFYFSGSYMETKGYFNDLESHKIVGLPVRYSSTGTKPFTLLFKREVNRETLRRASTNLRIVTNIPALRMVASFSTQTIWYTYSSGQNPEKSPVAWVDTDLSYHKITQAMLNDENYTIKGISLQKQRKNGQDNIPSKAPITWYISGRLTKELGAIGGISFYANNLFFYEPYLRSLTTNTLKQYNTNTFNFGVELFFNL